MNYLRHQTDFGKEFDQKIDDLNELIQRIYQVKNETPDNKDCAFVFM